MLKLNHWELNFVAAAAENYKYSIKIFETCSYSVKHVPLKNTKQLPIPIQKQLANKTFIKYKTVGVNVFNYL